MAPDDVEGGTPSSSLRVIGVVLAGVLLVGFFIHRGFPYDRLRAPIAAELSRAMGREVAIREVGPTFQLAGPGLVAHDARVSWGDGETLRIERAAVRPAWSLSWLRGKLTGRSPWPWDMPFWRRS